MPGPDPSVTPVFASDEDALAAAEELYGRYLEVANALGQSGWRDTTRLTDVTTGRALEDELKNAEDFVLKGYVQTGESTFDTVSIQQIEDQGRSHVSITVYLCLDVSQVDVVDKSGESVVSSSRPDRQALEVEMNDGDEKLKVTRSEAWSGANFCS